MAGWCLNHKDVDRFKQALLDGTINPEKLAEMSSKERRAIFADLFGEINAEPMNRALESKFLLKNQQQGYITWAQNLLGVRPHVKRDLISRIERMDTVLDAKSEQAFLEDLAAQKLGTRVSYEEAQQINELANKVQETEQYKGSDDTEKRMEYGRAYVALNNYVNDLKLQTNIPLSTRFKENPASTVVKGVTEIPGLTKSVQAAFDNSALFRQGWKTMMTNPMIWQRNARKSFADIAKTIAGQKTVADETQADIVSRPNYDLYKKAKLDVGNLEEAFPSHLPERIPGIGRLYKASEVAYTNFLHKTRADVFDKMVDVAERSGLDLHDPELPESQLLNVGRLVNSLTGRGYLGHAERALSAVNNIFFSPRNVKAHFDVLTQPFSGGTTLREAGSGDNMGSNFVRKQAAQNLLKIVGGIAAILAIAKALDPDSVDEDPRSANFGKIKVRNTRFDVTGGMGSLLTLAARLSSQSTKSSVTDNVRPLNERDKSGKPKFGAQTVLDVVETFLENKLSPIANVGKDFAKGQTFEGDKPTVAKETANLFTPLPLKNAIEVFQDPNSAPAVAALIADGLGMSTNTYGGSKQIQTDIKKAQMRGNTAEVERLRQVLGVTQEIEAKQKQTQKEANK